MLQKPSGQAIAPAALILGALVVTTTGPFIKLVLYSGVTAVELAFLRTAIAALVCVVATFATPSHRKELLSLPCHPGKPLYAAILAGVLFAAHYMTWMPALAYTSAFVAAMLGATSPVFVLIGSYLFLKEKSRPLAIIGVVVATLGVILTGVGDIGSPSGSNALLGDVLALGAAITYAGYALFARKARKTLSIVPFLAILFTTASILLLIIALATHSFTPNKSLQTLGMILYLSLVSTLVVHGCFNYALRYLKTATVSVAGLFEPIGAGVICFFLFGEKLGIWSLVGGALILCGISWYFVKSDEKPILTAKEKQ